jgi:hypothetical protein
VRLFVFFDMDTHGVQLSRQSGREASQSCLFATIFKNIELFLFNSIILPVSTIQLALEISWHFSGTVCIDNTTSSHKILIHLEAVIMTHLSLLGRSLHIAPKHVIYGFQQLGPIPEEEPFPCALSRCHWHCADTIHKIKHLLPLRII